MKETINSVSLNKRRIITDTWCLITRNQNREVRSYSNYENISPWKYSGFLETCGTCTFVIWTKLVSIDFCFSALKICQLYVRQFFFFSFSNYIQLEFHFHSFEPLEKNNDFCCIASSPNNFLLDFVFCIFFFLSHIHFLHMSNFLRTVQNHWFQLSSQLRLLAFLFSVFLYSKPLSLSHVATNYCYQSTRSLSACMHLSQRRDMYRFCNRKNKAYLELQVPETQVCYHWSDVKSSAPQRCEEEGGRQWTMSLCIIVPRFFPANAAKSYRSE